MDDVQNARAALSVAAIIFGIMAVGQLYRALAHINVVVQGVVMPSWISLVTAVVAFSLALWMGISPSRLNRGEV